MRRYLAVLLFHAKFIAKKVDSYCKHNQESMLNDVHCYVNDGRIKAKTGKFNMRGK